MLNGKLTARPERLFAEGRGAPSGAAASSLVNGSRGRHSESDGGYATGDDAAANTGFVGSPEEEYVSPSGSAGRPLDPSLLVDKETVYHNLWLFIWLKTIGSFDSGAFSAALGAPNGISEVWELNTTLQGTLTSSVFLGNVLGCPLAGHLFSRYNEKQILCIALIIHTVFTFLFATFPIYELALLNRFFIGISLSFIVVYTPVWVDEFAPKNRQSMWMASHNAGVPLGIMLGYIFAAGPQSFTSFIGWSWAFYIKCIFMVPTIAYVARVDSRTINTRKSPSDRGVSGISKDGDGGQHRAETMMSKGGAGAISQSVAASGGEEYSIGVAAAPSAPPLPGTPDPRGSGSAGVSLHTVWNTDASQMPRVLLERTRSLGRGLYAAVFPLLSNVVYMCCVVSLTSMYFVATGLQNFVTQYLREEPFNASMTTIMVGFGTAVVSAPVCGVITGGILLDRIGGYKQNLRRVALFVLAWGTCAVLFSIVCIFVNTTRGFLLVMSVVLFCGGAIIPPGAGLTMASLPDHLRSVGAAFSQTFYNLLGNFSGPLVCGWVADSTGKLRYGIITLLLSSTFGVVPVIGILYVAFRGSDAALGEASPHPVIIDHDEEDDALGETGGGFADGDGGCEMQNRVVSTGRAMAGGDWSQADILIDTAAPYPRNSATTLTRSSYQGGGTVVRKANEMIVESPIRASPHSFSERCNSSAHARRLHGDYAEASMRVPCNTLQPPASDMPQSAASSLSTSSSTGQPPSFTASVRRSQDSVGLLQGPGTARPMLVSGATLVTPPPEGTVAATAGGTSTPSATQAQRRREQQIADLELMNLEAETAKVMSLPNQHAFGMDLVRTWLSNEVKELHSSQTSRLPKREQR